MASVKSEVSVISTVPVENVKNFSINNVAKVFQDPKGGYCYYCLQKQCFEFGYSTCDNNRTLLCTNCGIDSVVPGSIIPSPINKSLLEWYDYYFGDSDFEEDEEDYDY